MRSNLNKIVILLIVILQSGTSFLSAEINFYSNFSTELNGHENHITDIVFLTSSTMASSGRDGKIIIWNIFTHTKTEIFRHNSPIYCLEKLPDQNKLLAGSFDGNILLIDFSNGGVEEFRIHQGAVYSIAVNPAAMEIASCGYDRKINIISLESMETIEQIEVDAVPTSLCFSEDGSFLACGSSDSRVRLLSDLTGSIAIADYITGEIWDVSFLPGSNNLCCWSRDGSIEIWNPADNSYTTAEISDSRIWTGIVDDTNGYILSGTDDGRLYITDIMNQLNTQEVLSLPNPVTAIGARDDNAIIAIGCADGIIHLIYSQPAE